MALFQQNDDRIRDLLPQWLQDGEQGRRKRARAAWEKYKQLGDKTTEYARACRRIAEVHNAAADVYATALETEQLLEHGPGDDPRGQIGQ